MNTFSFLFVSLSAGRGGGGGSGECVWFLFMWCVHIYPGLCVHVWKLENNVGSSVLSFSFPFETGSTTETGAGLPAHKTSPSPSTGVRGVYVFMSLVRT